MLSRRILRAGRGASPLSLVSSSPRGQVFGGDSSAAPVLRRYSSRVAGHPSAALPLAGYRVLDLTRVLAGVSSGRTV